jgi:hypothetical protein
MIKRMQSFTMFLNFIETPDGNLTKNEEPIILQATNYKLIKHKKIKHKN